MLLEIRLNRAAMAVLQPGYQGKEDGWPTAF
jgi:hypothetical protein